MTEAELSQAKELNEKLELEKQAREERIAILNALDTRRLIDQIPKLQLDWERAVRDDITYRNLNSKYLASYTSDCAEVKSMLAELAFGSPGTFSKVDPTSGREIAGTEKKTTQAEREAWLELQRTMNNKLSGAISMQNSVTMMTENNRINIEVARKKLDSVLAVLGLRTAQIEFLSG